MNNNHNKQELKAQSYPSLIKYMGSKSKIIDFVFEGLNEVYNGGVICDLFAGSASLAGAIGQQCEVHSNDIQSYSAILANTYNKAYIVKDTPTISELISKAEKIVKTNKKDLNTNPVYSNDLSLEEFNTRCSSFFQIDEYNQKSNKQVSVNCHVFQHYVIA